MCLSDPRSYIAGTEVPGRFNLAGQVPGERSDPPGWGLGEGPITLPCKNYLLRKPQSGLMRN